MRQSSNNLPHCIGKTKLYRSFRELPWTNGYYNPYALKGCIFHEFEHFYSIYSSNIQRHKVNYIKLASKLY